MQFAGAPDYLWAGWPQNLGATAVNWPNPKCALRVRKTGAWYFWIFLCRALVPYEWQTYHLIPILTAAGNRFLEPTRAPAQPLLRSVDIRSTVMFGLHCLLDRSFYLLFYLEVLWWAGASCSFFPVWTDCCFGSTRRTPLCLDQKSAEISWKRSSANL